MHGPQPALWPGKKAERRHHVERNREIEGSEPSADQTHVVIEREPTHEHVGRCSLYDEAHCPDVRQQVGVAQHHPLRIASASGCVLDEAGRGAVAQDRQRDIRALGRQALDASHRIDRGHEAPQHCGGLQSFGDRHENAGPGIAEDAGLAAHELFDLRQLHRWIDRYRHGASIKNAQKGDEELRARGQHERDPVARRDIGLDQTRRYGTGGLAKLPIGQCGEHDALVLQHREVLPVGVRGNMPVECLDQCPRLFGGMHKRKLRQRRRERGRNSEAIRRHLSKRVEDIADGVGFA